MDWVETSDTFCSLRALRAAGVQEQHCYVNVALLEN